MLHQLTGLTMKPDCKGVTFFAADIAGNSQKIEDLGGGKMEDAQQ